MLTELTQSTPEFTTTSRLTVSILISGVIEELKRRIAWFAGWRWSDGSSGGIPYGWKGRETGSGKKKGIAIVHESTDVHETVNM
jgi:hypothetical protein